jgi:hypothetical protein
VLARPGALVDRPALLADHCEACCHAQSRPLKEEQVSRTHMSWHIALQLLGSCGLLHADSPMSKCAAL